MSKRVISFHCTLTNAAGEKLDSTVGGEPMTILEGGGQVIPLLEKELVQLQVGEKKRIAVKAAEAYGLRDEKKVQEILRKKMPSQKIKVGDRFRGGHEHDSPIYTVTNMTDTHVTLDSNHPLAGMDLTFDVELTSIRDATKEELEHGHVHGHGGHHH